MLSALKKARNSTNLGDMGSTLCRTHQPVLKREYSSEWGRSKGMLKFYQRNMRRPIVIAMILGGSTFCFYKIYQRRQSFLPDDPNNVGKHDDNYIYLYSPGTHGFFRKHLTRLPVISSWWDPTTHFFKQQGGENPFRFRDETDFKYACQCLSVKEVIGYAREGGDLSFFISPYRQTFSEINVVHFLRQMLSNFTGYSLDQCLLEQVEVSFRHVANSIESVNAQSLVESSGFDAVAGDTIPQPRVSEENVVIISLTAVLSLSIDRKRISVLMESNVLGYLTALYKKFDSNQEVVSLIVKILANISVDTSTRQSICDSGCLYILAKAARDDNIHLSFPAQRALHNLDREEGGDVLLPGIYQMYPEKNYKDGDIDYDIVFVHGILGSAYKTWRRQENSAIIEERKMMLTGFLQQQLAEMSKGDQSASIQANDETFESFLRKRTMLKKSDIPQKYHSQLLLLSETDVKAYIHHWPNDVMDSKSSKFYPHVANDVVTKDTSCWPKDWLSLDCPNGRVINVDFESFLSTLWSECPVEQYQDGLEHRAKEMMHKLIAAGVGKRPIIFVCHSMGGLIAKYIIVESNTSEDAQAKAIADKTKAVVFYSTPHYGSDTGRKWLDKGGRFLGPTKEFEQIAGANESFEDLISLQEKFSKIYESRKYKVVSLSELKSSYGPYGMELHIVPRSSSDMGHGENYAVLLDHLNINKPFCRRSFVYIKLVAILHELFPAGVSYEKVRPPFALEKDSNYDEICARVGLSKYGIVDPYIIAGYIRGPKEVEEREKLNRESQDGLLDNPDNE